MSEHQQSASTRRRRRVSRANPERAVVLGTRVGEADRDILERIAYHNRVTTADLLRLGIQPMLDAARAGELDLPDIPGEVSAAA